MARPLAPRRYLVRYRRPGDAVWRRSPKFVTRTTGHRTRAEAVQTLKKLQGLGFVGHVDTYDHLRVLALAEAWKLVGIMEHGGNNRGERVMEIIRANGGTGPEPWCGDTMAWCYRHAGSLAVAREWAAVRLIDDVPGTYVIGKRAAEPGDMLRFTFDHVGMLVHYCDAQSREVAAAIATHVKTIEGNTGPSGAVSDSSTGGDGVYVKIHPLTEVADAVMVTR